MDWLALGAVVRMVEGALVHSPEGIAVVSVVPGQVPGQEVRVGTERMVQRDAWQVYSVCEGKCSLALGAEALGGLLRTLLCRGKIVGCCSQPQLVLICLVGE